MAKQLLFDREAREAMKRGVEKMARTIKGTLGPRGRSVIIDRGWGAPNVTEDGATVADEIDLADPYENLGARMVKEAASKTSDDAGDGTTTASVLTERMYLEGLRRITAGVDPVGLARGCMKASSAIAESLAKMSRKVETNDEIRMVATIAAKNDKQIGGMIADAMAKVGKDGVITVEEGKGTQTEVKIVEGMQFDRGYLSPQFVNEADTAKVVLEKPYLLLLEDKLSSIRKLIPILEACAQDKRALVVIAEDVEGEALATLVVNKLRGILHGAACKAPGYGDRRKAMLEDIATLTGGKVVSKDLGVDLGRIDQTYLGTAQKVVMTADETTIIQGAGKTAEIKARVEHLRREIEKTDSDYDREKLEERVAKLSGGVAVIKVGAVTEAELKEKKSRVEDALHATRAAVAEGIVSGGGTALVRAGEALKSLKLTGPEAAGVEVVQKALEAPLVQIADNAGMDGTVVLHKVRSNSGDYGFDAERQQYGDLFKFGVVDPTKVVRLALQNAASSAGMLLTTDCIIADLPEEKGEEAHPHGPGGEEMGGMGGMGMGGMGGMGMGGMGGMGMGGMGGMGDSMDM